MAASKIIVYVKYKDGRTEEYGSLKEAGAALGVDTRAIRKFEFGRGRKRQALESMGIESIKAVKRPPYQPGFQQHHHRVPIRLTHVDGRVLEFDRQQDAEIYLNISIGTLARWRREGIRHDGWLVEEIETDEPKIRYGDMPVPQDYIDQMYRMANHYLIKYWGRYSNTDQDAEDAVQYAVAKVAADYSQGKYDPVKTPKWQTWAYCMLKHYCYEHLEAVEEQAKMMDDGPVEGRDEWLARLATALPEDRDDEFLAEMPVDLAEVARLLLEGRNQYEISCLLGKAEKTIRRIESRIVRWIAGGGEVSDSG